jgi:hypothetical protein
MPIRVLLPPQSTIPVQSSLFIWQLWAKIAEDKQKGRLGFVAAFFVAKQ